MIVVVMVISEDVVAMVIAEDADGDPGDMRIGSIAGHANDEEFRNKRSASVTQQGDKEQTSNVIIDSVRKERSLNPWYLVYEQEYAKHSGTHRNKGSEHLDVAQQDNEQHA